MAQPQAEHETLVQEVSEGIEAPEPWEDWETKLVGYSIAIGIGVLIIGGIVANMILL